MARGLEGDVDDGRDFGARGLLAAQLRESRLDRRMTAAVVPKRVEEHSRQPLLRRAIVGVGRSRVRQEGAVRLGAEGIVDVGEGANAPQELLFEGRARWCEQPASRRAGSTSGCRVAGCR